VKTQLADYREPSRQGGKAKAEQRQRQHCGITIGIVGRKPQWILNRSSMNPQRGQLIVTGASSNYLRTLVAQSM
jgi:hypothetical protein